MTDEALWDVPEPISTRVVRLDYDAVATLRRHGNPDGPRLVLGHGNGLAIDAYYPFWSLLLDDFDIILHDLRNHGWNSRTGLEHHDIPTFIADHNRVLNAIDTSFGAKPKVGVYHSLSALIALLSLSSLLAPDEERATISALVLFDPPLYKPGASEVRFDESAERLARGTRRRTERFDSPAQFVELLRYSPSYFRVVPGTLELIARTTLRETRNGDGFELCCPAEYEARIVEYVRSYGGLVDFEHLPCPIKVVGADPTVPYSYLPTLDLAEMGTVDYDFLPDATHFLQLEQPQACVDAVRSFLDEVRHQRT